MLLSTKNSRVTKAERQQRSRRIIMWPSMLTCSIHTTLVSPTTSQGNIAVLSNDDDLSSSLTADLFALRALRYSFLTIISIASMHHFYVVTVIVIMPMVCT